MVHELHHVNRAVSVVSVEEIEGPWRSKVIKLEKQLLELELMVKKNAGRPIVETKQVVVEDQNAVRHQTILRLGNWKARSTTLRSSFARKKSRSRTFKTRRSNTKKS